MGRLPMRVMVGNIVPSTIHCAIHSDVGTFSNVFLAAERSATGGTEAAVNVLRSCGVYFQVIEFFKAHGRRLLR